MSDIQEQVGLQEILQLKLANGYEFPVNSVRVEYIPSMPEAPGPFLEIVFTASPENTVDALLTRFTPEACNVITITKKDGTTQTLSGYTVIGFCREEYSSTSFGSTMRLLKRKEQ